MFNWWRSMGFIDDNDMPMKRWGFKVTLEIEEDDKHDKHDFDDKPTAEWFIEKVNHMLFPLIDMWEAKVETNDKEETITIWDWKIIRPVVEVEVVPLEEVIDEVIADDLIPTL